MARAREIDLMTYEVPESHSGQSRYGGRGYGDYRLKLTAAPDGMRYKVRFLGNFFMYDQHFNRIDGETTEFGDERQGISRRCTGENCPWCRLGYEMKPRWIVNVAHLGEEHADEDGDPQIMFIELPISGMKAVMTWAKENREDFPKGPGDMEGEAPDFVIIVTGSPGYGGSGITKYEITQVGRPKTITDGIKRGISKINQDGGNELHDLNELCRPHHMPEELQIKKFGEVIDPVPTNELDELDV